MTLREPMTRAIAAAAPVQQRSAGLLRRIAAIVYDTLLIAALLMIYTFIVVAARGMREVEPDTWWFNASLVGLHALFHCWFWVHGGQTLGLRAWRARVVRSDGTPLGWGRAAARYLAAALSLVPAGLGFWWSLLDRNRRCWHDIATGTKIVRV